MDLNQASLFCLPYILSRCKRILCIVDRTYFSRLWCMFEVGTFMRARPDGKVTFVYNWQVVFFMVIFLGSCGNHMASRLLSLIDWKDLTEALNWGDIISIFLTDWVIFSIFYFVCRMYFQTETEMREMSKSFDVRNATCGVITDKPLLLDAIRRQFADRGDSPTSTDPLEKFNSAVRKILREQYAATSGRVLPYRAALAATIAKWFGARGVSVDKLFSFAPWDLEQNIFLFKSNGYDPIHLESAWFTIGFTGLYLMFIVSPLSIYIITAVARCGYNISEKFEISHWFLFPLVLFTLQVLNNTENTWLIRLPTNGLICAFGIGGKKMCPYDNAEWFLEHTSNGSFYPLWGLFNCFGTGCLSWGGDHPVNLKKVYSPAMQIVYVFLFLIIVVSTWFIYEPDFAKRWRHELWDAVRGNKRSDSADKEEASASNSPASRRNKDSNSSQSSFRKRLVPNVDPDITSARFLNEGEPITKS